MAQPGTSDLEGIIGWLDFSLHSLPLLYIRGDVKVLLAEQGMADNQAVKTRMNEGHMLASAVSCSIVFPKKWQRLDNTLLFCGEAERTVERLKYQVYTGQNGVINFRPVEAELDAAIEGDFAGYRTRFRF
jgi:hypothetical protein